MHTIIVVYLWYIGMRNPTCIVGQVHSSLNEITVGKYSRRNEDLFIIDLPFLFRGGVFTDRDEGIDIHHMESVFKYAIFHYNRLSKDAHNISYKIRLQEETLSLIAAESAVQTVQDGR